VKRLIPLMLLGVGCTTGPVIPSDNVQDYRMTFFGASASDSCSDDIKAEADTWEENSLIYRVHFVDGPDSARIDVWWRGAGSSESDFTFFGAGTLDGTLESGVFQYGSSGFQEERDTGTVWYDIDGRAPVRFTDEISQGSEDFVITQPTSADGFAVGCVFTVLFNGARLNENDVTE